MGRGELKLVGLSLVGADGLLAGIIGCFNEGVGVVGKGRFFVDGEDEGESSGEGDDKNG